MFKINKELIEKKIMEAVKEKIKENRNLKIHFKNSDEVEKEINSSIQSLGKAIKDGNF